MFARKAVFTITAVVLFFAGTVFAAEWEIIQSGIDPGVRRIEIPLTIRQGESRGQQRMNKPVKSERLPKSEDGYSTAINLGVAPDGKLIRILLKPAEDVKFLNNLNGQQTLRGRIQLSSGKDRFKTLQEGLVSFGGQIPISLEVPPLQAGEKPTVAIMNVDLNGRNDDEYSASVYWTWERALEGTVMLSNARLSLRIAGITPDAEGQRTAEFTIQPFDATAPADSYRGKLTDLATIRKCRVAVEKLAKDNSAAVVAILSGDIEAAPRDEMTVGAEVPTFARVDLIRRRLVTLSELRADAGANGQVLLIFGELPVSGQQMYGYGAGAADRLTLDPSIIVKTVTPEGGQPPLVAFIVRSLSISDVYQTWLANEPPFRVFSDYSNPLDLSFQLPNQGYMGTYPSERESLRKQLSIPAGKIALVLIDGDGKAALLRTDAAATLSADLMAARDIIAGTQ